MGGDKCLQLTSRDFLYPITRHPLPSLPGLEFELQTSPANLFLSHNVYFLPPGTPQPHFSAPSRTVNGESQPCPSHPFKAINGDGNHTTQCSLLAGCPEHGAPHTKNPDGSRCHQTFFIQTPNRYFTFQRVTLLKCISKLHCKVRGDRIC